MPDTPPVLRGRFYSTHSYARCPEYKRCQRCQMCSNYNRHSALCEACEGTKPGRKHECTFVQLVALNEFVQKIGRPIFDINQEPSKVITETVGSTAYDDEWTKSIRQMG